MMTCPTEPLQLPCPCCLTLLLSGEAAWHRICPKCGYESAQFSNAINMPHASLSEPQRENGLHTLRESNFKVLLDRMLAHLSSQHQTLLEVGCGHGWFLELAMQRFNVTGIEPDSHILQAARAKGLNVIEGYFPCALHEGDRFDVIVFNDVLEHVPDLPITLQACLGALNPNGLLVLNLPTSKGVFYFLAKLGRRLGIEGAFERMWQKDFPSPHIHYFDQSNLTLLLANCGFKVSETGTLPSIRLKGLYDRIAYTHPNRRVRNSLVWLALVLSYPLARCLPSDAMMVFAVLAHNSPES